MNNLLYILQTFTLVMTLKKFLLVVVLIRRHGYDVGDVVMGGGWNPRDLVGSGGFIFAAGGDGDPGRMNTENLVSSGGGVGDAVVHGGGGGSPHNMVVDVGDAVVLGGGRGVAIRKF
nr:hypothetical protein [Tanacetum cinerariifolium]